MATTTIDAALNGISRSRKADYLTNRKFICRSAQSSDGRVAGMSRLLISKRPRSLSPNDTWPLQNLAFNYAVLRNFDAANKTVDRALELNPRGIGLCERKIRLAIAEKGDFSVYEKVKAFRMSSEERLTFGGLEADLLLLQRNNQQVLQLYESAPDDSLAAVPFLLGAKYFTIGIAKKTWAMTQRLALRSSERRTFSKSNSSNNRTTQICTFEWLSCWRGLVKRTLASQKRNARRICGQKPRMHSKVQTQLRALPRFMQSSARTPARSNCWAGC